MNHNTPLYMGLDIGSVSVNAVVLDEKCGFVYDRYIRSHGRPLQVVSDVFREVAEQFPWRLIRTLAVTGSGADLVLENYGGRKINEVVAQAQGVLHYYPQVKTVIEMGGEDSKLIILKNGSLVDFSMNSICAAGTGSFLDQQATRLKINIENEFGELALKSVDPPRIAGRCSVFAKSDMIHLQQIATPDYDILAGLCFAMARNFKGTVARGRILETPVSFQGGVAANAGMVRAIREVFELTDDQLIIPERHSSMGAAGAALTVKVSGQDGFIFPDLDKLTMIQPYLDRGNGHPPLEYNYPASKHYSFDIDLSKKAGVVSGYLGIDVGSLSTNLVIIDSENNVLAREYLMTEGRPLEAICRGLKKIEAEVGEKVRIKAAGTTGSGRYLTADFVGADLVKNEITCQATAAIALDPTVDTIFEIGGQDSKYVSIDNGVVIDFEMNKACAAGTGSFLQEQAEKLGIKIEDEFSHLAFGSECPVGCGERCTVFMESDLVSRQQAGACKEDLVAGLAYSIVHNYLNKVVAGRRVGERIFFQGGVAWNKSVVAAFEKVLDKEIIVPPNHDVTGAIGAAILARDHVVDGNTGFKGFGLYKRSYILTSFTCEDCPNSCHIHKIEREGDGDLYYGSRCEKYESRGRPKNDLVDTVAQRNRIMFGAARAGQAGKPTGKGKKIVLPLAVSNWDLYPFWGRFFDVLGHRVKLSGKTTRDKINRGCDIVASETCFPVKIAHGHLTDKTALEADFIFLPSVVAMPPAGEKEKFRRYFCPYIQSLPYIIRAALGDDKKHITEKIIHANIDFHLGPKAVARWLYPLGKRLGNGKREVDRAFRAAMDCYNDYRRRLREKGNEFLDRLPDDRIALVIVGRPYNTCDYGANMGLPDKIRQLGVPFVPIDYLPVEDFDHDVPDSMYWNYGRKILAAAGLIKADPRLYAVYLTNFGCGPDSFISHQFRRIMDGKPFLQLEIDEHSADAGFITRIEAFIDHLKKPDQAKAESKKIDDRFQKDFSKHKIYIPDMCDHAFGMASVLRSCALEAEVLPEPDQSTLEAGRRFTSGRECFPAILTTGDIVKMVESEGFDRNRSAFLMPTAGGPCRFGQYYMLHRQVLDELGYGEVPVYYPSSQDSYSKFITGKGKFRRQAWTAVVAVDILAKMLHHCRPYEIEKGICNGIYGDGLNRLCGLLERGDDPLPSLEDAAIRFREASKSDKRKPLVGVIGEIYIRNNRFSNNDIIKKLERLGCEVYLEPFSEWILFTTYMYSRNSRETWDWKGVLKSEIQNWLQNFQDHRLTKALDIFPGIYRETPVNDVVEKAFKYLEISIGGESILSIGKGLELIESGAAGVVNTLPFTCMPGNVITAISKKIRTDHPDFPWLNMSYEGLEDTGDWIRLEAFVHQVSEYQKRT